MVVELVLAAMIAGGAMPMVDFPVVERLEPLPAKVGEKLTIHGQRFGDDRADGHGMVWVARCKSMPGAPGAAGMMEHPRSQLLSWSDTKIEFIVPPRAAGVLAVTSMIGRISPPFEFDVEDECEAKAAPQGP